MRGLLSKVMQGAAVVVCVTALAVLTIADEDEESDSKAVGAVQEFRDEADADGLPGWVLDTLYSERVTRWLVRRLKAVAQEEGLI